MRATIAFMTSLMLAGAAAADRVERRGGEAAIEGVINSIEDKGITIRSSGSLAVTQTVSWDRVRDFQADRIIPDRDSWMQLAMQCWRARTRVERQDTELAEPTLERLFERFAGQTHEPALVAAEGLLRCRLARGDQAGAVIPWLETVRIRRGGAKTKSYSNLPRVIDEATWLCPALPPVFAESVSVARLAQQLRQYDAKGDALVAELAGRYVSLLPGASPQEKTDANASKEPSLELLNAISRCRAADTGQRRDGAAALTALLKRSPSWFEPWARFEIGIAMSLDESLRERQAGLVQLMHLPARFSKDQPHLAAIALRRAAAVLQSDGSADEAAALLEELSRTFPDSSVPAAAPASRPRTTMIRTP